MRSVTASVAHRALILREAALHAANFRHCCYGELMGINVSTRVIQWGKTSAGTYRFKSCWQSAKGDDLLPTLSPGCCLLDMQHCGIATGSSTADCLSGTTPPNRFCFILQLCTPAHLSVDGTPSNTFPGSLQALFKECLWYRNLSYSIMREFLSLLEKHGVTLLSPSCPIRSA